MMDCSLLIVHCSTVELTLSRNQFRDDLLLTSDCFLLSSDISRFMLLRRLTVHLLLLTI
jgi:hypothetical protein